LFNGISISELLELQKLRKSGAGIDITKLNKGVIKKKPKKVAEEDMAEYGLRPGAGPPPPAEESVHGPLHVLTELMGWLSVMKTMQKPKPGGS
jgi:hypothetical protein